MRINHIIDPNRSRFYPIIVAAIHKAGAGFPTQPVTCNLGKPKAYSGDVDITIISGSEFDANWNYPDASRFPHRIRAAATALRDTGHHKKFHVSHHDGILVIS